jgi:PRC-barrel domain
MEAPRVFEADDIREWRGHNVVDDSGTKIGELEALYVDTRTDDYEFATVKVGLLSRQRLVFVPTAGATVGPSYFKVRFPKKQVRDAPSIDTDGELLATDEPAVFRHYEMPYEAGESERLLARR